jgi:hypothetical protein
MPLCLSKTQQIISMGGWCKAALILASGVSELYCMRIENESDKIKDGVLIRIVSCADGIYVNDYYTADFDLCLDS